MSHFGVGRALAATAFLVAVCRARGPTVVNVTVDATGASAEPFTHNWKKCWGSGHAKLTLRQDWRLHLRQARDELGLQGVRYHGLFDDDMGVVTAPRTYNFTKVDSTWDYFIELGVKPVVELSFMPAFLANCSWEGVNPNAPKCTSTCFAYHGITQTPAVWEDWYDLVYATVDHAVQRYGLAEVQSWAFEVWNELWGMSYPEPYNTLYNASVLAVKAVHPSLKVGGPATAQLQHVADFAAASRESGLPVDFISTHHYPSDPGCPRGEQWDPDCFTRNVLKARASVPNHTFYLTEYNVGCCLGWPQHDVPAAAAFVFRQVGALNSDLDLYSYWTFTDVFEEGGLPDVEFKDIYGSKTIHGIPKPVWRGFQLLNTHAGSLRLAVTVDQGADDPALAAARQPNEACSLVPDTDFRGADILPDSQHLLLPDAGACCAACQANTSCGAWAYGGPDSHCCKGRCYLKRATGSTPAHDPTMTSGYPGPAPSPPVKPFVAAMATTNSSTDHASLRVFISHWTDDGGVDENRTVRTIVRHADGRAPGPAVLYVIDGTSTNPRAAWEAMGSPAVPDPSQMAALMKASEVSGPNPVKTVALNATATLVTVPMTPNSAAVVAFAS